MGKSPLNLQSKPFLENFHYTQENCSKHFSAWKKKLGKKKIEEEENTISNHSDNDEVSHN